MQNNEAKQISLRAKREALLSELEMLKANDEDFDHQDADARSAVKAQYRAIRAVDTELHALIQEMPL